MKKHPVLIAGLLSFAALLLIAVLLGIYRYDASCPLPALRKTLKQQEYEDCYFSSIRPVPVKRYITDPPETVYTYIEVRYKFHSFPPPERLFQAAAEIRGIVVQYMQAHPEETDGQRIAVSFHDENDASPHFIRFTNFEQDNDRNKPEPCGLMYGYINLPCELSVYVELRGFRFLRLSGFPDPEDLSALNGINTLEKLSLYPQNGNGVFYVPQAVLDAFYQKHPDCELTGSIRSEAERPETEGE